MLHPDAHIFAQEFFYQAKTKVVIAIMTQLSFKVGLKEWRDKAHSASKRDMKHLHLMNTFIHIHMRDITYEER